MFKLYLQLQGVGNATHSLLFKEARIGDLVRILPNNPSAIAIFCQTLQSGLWLMLIAM